jgi:hypothetical protein
VHIVSAYPRRRSIALPKSVVESLKRHKARQAERRLKASEARDLPREEILLPTCCSSPGTDALVPPGEVKLGEALRAGKTPCGMLATGDLDWHAGIAAPVPALRQLGQYSVHVRGRKCSHGARCNVTKHRQ